MKIHGQRGTVAITIWPYAWRQIAYGAVDRHPVQKQGNIFLDNICFVEITRAVIELGLGIRELVFGGILQHPQDRLASCRDGEISGQSCSLLALNFKNDH
jgi:hypothetical protein